MMLYGVNVQSIGLVYFRGTLLSTLNVNLKRLLISTRYTCFPGASQIRCRVSLLLGGILRNTLSPASVHLVDGRKGGHVAALHHLEDRVNGNLASTIHIFAGQCTRERGVVTHCERTRNRSEDFVRHSHRVGITHGALLSPLVGGTHQNLTGGANSLAAHLTNARRAVGWSDPFLKEHT